MPAHSGEVEEEDGRFGERNDDCDIHSDMMSVWERVQSDLSVLRPTRPPSLATTAWPSLAFGSLC